MGLIEEPKPSKKGNTGQMGLTREPKPLKKEGNTGHMGLIFREPNPQKKREILANAGS